MNDTTAGKVIEYGRTLMSIVAGGEPAMLPAWSARFTELLQAKTRTETQTETRSQPADRCLQSIFSLIERDGKVAQPAFFAPYPLSLDEVDPVPDQGDNGAWRLFPVGDDDPRIEQRRALYAQFVAAGGGKEAHFDRFFHLMRKYASTLPARGGEPGISLFQEWKTVAALAQISGSVDAVPGKPALVGGDIPGIQRTINMVTSKGAAKAMRGRSAFIQLLGSALVQRLLDDLGLGPANVVYDAGGNFLLLAGWQEELPGVVHRLATEVNEALLAGVGDGNERFDGFHGDLAVALAAVPLPLTALRCQGDAAGGDAISPWQDAERTIKEAVAAAKARPFGDLALAGNAGWNALFAPDPSETDDFCAVCRRQRRADEAPFVEMLDDVPEDISIGSSRQCPECVGFNVLATTLGRKGARLSRSKERGAGSVSEWQTALAAVSGDWYVLTGEDEHSTGEWTVSLSLDGFPSAGVDGFQLLARTTPLTAAPAPTIKPNDVLADASTGLKRLGILRMDVDDLGDLIVNGLPQRTLMATAELSESLERFFAGWLDRICHRVDGGRGLFYVLFAGGDDLFVIGPWSLMAPLATAINEDFRRYTGEHPAIHLSAGIAVVEPKSPLYAAADLAHAALDAAKDLETQGGAQRKDAITFMGETYHWRAFAEVESQQAQLVQLLDVDGLPSSLLTTLRSIEQRYRRDLTEEPEAWGRWETDAAGSKRVHFGPWMWQQAYAIARMKQSHSSVAATLTAMERKLLNGKIDDLGLAVRWAQWITRKES